MSFDPQQQFIETSMGELKTDEMSPVVQVGSEYGILEQVITSQSNGGTTSTVDNKFTCQTGTSADGSASIVTLRQLKSRHGQGAVGRVTTIFNPGVAGSIQLAGLLSAENSLAFAFFGETFGLIRLHDGETENQELTITVAGTGVATITIDDVDHLVTLTVGTAQHNAFEIANSLNAIPVPNYIFTSNDDQVVAQSFTAEPMGAFGFTGSTATAAWVQITAARSPIPDFIAQTAWNVDTRISTDSKENLDPLVGNKYAVHYSDFGAIRFYVDDRESGKLTLVHVIEYSNSSILPSVSNPIFRVGWSVANLGNTTSLTLSGSSASAFIEGKVIVTGPQRSDKNNNAVPVGTLTNIATYRVRSHFVGKGNKIEVLPLTLSLSTQTNKFAFFVVLANPTFGGDLNFRYKDKATSVIEIATDPVEVFDGTEVQSETVVPGSSVNIRFNDRENIQTATFPTQSFTIAAIILTGGMASDCQAGTSWVEDF